jgi:hypothetical protein
MQNKADPASKAEIAFYFVTRFPFGNPWHTMMTTDSSRLPYTIPALAPSRGDTPGTVKVEVFLRLYQ